MSAGSRASSHRRAAVVVALALFAAAGVVIGAASAPDWARFRGPNGSGISTATGVPKHWHLFHVVARKP